MTVFSIDLSMMGGLPNGYLNENEVAQLPFAETNAPG